jgi:hypothetical protein
METYDAARAPGARRCEEIVFPSSLSDDVIQAAADPLNRSASNQRGQVSRGQSEVPYLVRPKVRWDALYAEPVKSAVAQTMQSVEIEIEIELGEAIKWSNARQRGDVPTASANGDKQRVRRRGSPALQLFLCSSCHFFTAAMVLSTCWSGFMAVYE